MDDIKLSAKYEKELGTLIQAVRIYNQDIGMQCGIEKCVMLIIKSRIRHMTEEMELPNPEKIRTLGEKKTYKYLEILEADTIKQVEMKEKTKKNISGERESYSKPSYIAGTYKRDKHLGYPPQIILRTIP